jgi:hypothetical protein
VQLGLAVALVANTQSAALQRALVLVIVAFYGSALGRAWEVTGRWTAAGPDALTGGVCPPRELPKAGRLIDEAPRRGDQPIVAASITKR